MMKTLTINITNLTINVTEPAAGKRFDPLLLEALLAVATADSSHNAQDDTTSDTPADTTPSQDQRDEPLATVDADQVSEGDRVAYVRPDGTSFTGEVLTVDYDDNDNDKLIIRIRKDDNGKVTRLYNNIDGKFHLL